MLKSEAEALIERIELVLLGFYTLANPRDVAIEKAFREYLEVREKIKKERGRWSLKAVRKAIPGNAWVDFMYSRVVPKRRLPIRPCPRIRVV